MENTKNGKYFFPNCKNEGCTEDSICCDGTCHKCYHRSCSGVTKKAFKLLNDNRNSK